MQKAPSQSLWKRASHLGRRSLLVGLVVVVIIAFAALFISLASTPSPASRLADEPPTPTVTLAPTFTPTSLPTSTATPLPTATPVYVAPTATPAPPQGPFFAPASPSGGQMWTGVLNAHCPTSEQLEWQAVIQLDMPLNGSILYHWVRYDGAAPGQPADVIFSAYEPTPEYPWTRPTYATNPVRIGADDTWNITSADMTGSTARWGDQLVIDAVNGEPLATPLATEVYYLPTGC